MYKYASDCCKNKSSESVNLRGRFMLYHILWQNWDLIVGKFARRYYNVSQSGTAGLIKKIILTVNDNMFWKELQGIRCGRRIGGCVKGVGG